VGQPAAAEHAPVPSRRSEAELDVGRTAGEEAVDRILVRGGRGAGRRAQLHEPLVEDCVEQGVEVGEVAVDGRRAHSRFPCHGPKAHAVHGTDALEHRRAGPDELGAEITGGGHETHFTDVKRRVP
jgi:hypothetical protein